MKKADLMVTVSLSLVSASFWIFLAWAYLTNQEKASFYVGAAVVGVGVTFAIDAFLLLFGVVWATVGLLKNQVSMRKVLLKWLILFVAPIPSYLLANKASLALFASLAY